MSEERNEEFLNEMLALTKQNVLTWHNMVEKLSSNDDRITKWNDILKRNIEDVYNDIFADVSDNQEKLLNGIEQLLQQSEVLCKSLHIKMPNYGSDGLGLYEEQEILMNMIAKFEVQLEKKTKEITKLIEEEQNLCKALGCEQMKLQLSPLPTEDVIEKFKTHLEMLESEKFDRDEKYLKIKSSILDIVNIINYRPQLDFERTVLSHNDSLFLVTEENMERLEQFHTKLEMQYNKIKERIDILKDRLKRLWEILSEDIQKCNEFLEENVGVNYDTLRAYEDEVKRCEALKSANIEKFIKQLREEMELLWDKCHMTCAEKKTFQYFEDSIYNEDLLTLHDHEIQRLKTFYNKNCELFELLDKRNEHWKKLEELDQQALAPDRYKNRGGQLLLEEKQRNFLRKGIPKIEQKLVELSEKYERETGKVFTSWGKTIGSLIEDTADNYIYKKKIQLSARKQQRDQTITPGKSIPSLSTAVSSQNLAFLTPSTLKQISQNLGVRPIKSTVKESY